MRYIQLLYCIDSSKTLDLGIHAVKCAGLYELSLPGILIIACHIVVRMVTCYYHQRTKDDFLIACFLYLVDDSVACGIFRLTLNGTDEYVLVAQILHLCLHLIIGHICCMGSTMAHEYKCGAILSSCIYTVIACLRNSLACDCFCYCLLIIINNGCILTYFAEHRLCDRYGFKFVLVCINGLYHLVILCTMHQMCRLYNQVLDTICDCTVKCLLHVIDLLTVSCLYVVDDNLCGEGSSYGPVRISFLQCILDALDILCTAVIEGSTEADYKQLVFSDLILVARIILRSISGITAKILRACLLALYKCLLCIGQCVPCSLCLFTLCIGVIRALLYIDRIDQGCYLICSCLIIGSL